MDEQTTYKQTNVHPNRQTGRKTNTWSCKETFKWMDR
jgi:hypothetical protein